MRGSKLDECAHRDQQWQPKPDLGNDDLSFKIRGRHERSTQQRSIAEEAEIQRDAIKRRQREQAECRETKRRSKKQAARPEQAREQRQHLCFLQNC